MKLLCVSIAAWKLKRHVGTKPVTPVCLVLLHIFIVVEVSLILLYATMRIVRNSIEDWAIYVPMPISSIVLAISIASRANWKRPCVEARLPGACAMIYFMLGKQVKWTSH